MKTLLTFLLALTVAECLVVIDDRPVSNTKYFVEGDTVKFSCESLGEASVLTWFRLFNSSVDGHVIKQQVARRFTTLEPTFASDFDSPKGRTSLERSNLIVKDIKIADQGVFYCDISLPSSSLQGSKTALVVWHRPEPPVVEKMDNLPLTENITSNVARCISMGGKPGSNITWWNGTEEITKDITKYQQVNEDDGNLVNSFADMKITKPTRFDHQRVFSCKVEHESYYGEHKIVNYTLQVQYKPVNVYIWANLTTSVVYCEADSYPSPSFDWFAPGETEYKNTQKLEMNNLYKYPGYQYFECIAHNIVGKQSARIMLDDLLYPDGKPGFAGLDYWIWGVIGGGVLLLLIILIIICCCCRRKKKPKGKTLNNSKLPNKDAYSVEILASNDTHRYSQPSLIEMEYRSASPPSSSRNSAAPPSDRYPVKSAMKKNYSLERIVDEKYGSPSNMVTSPTGGNMVATTSSNHYDEGSLNRRPSKEELDDVADHIELLSKSWDNLARSRENLNQSREELRVNIPPPYRPVDDNPGPHGQHTGHHQGGQHLPGHPFGDRGFVSLERLNDDDSQCPYMDDTERRNDERGSQEYIDRHHGNQDGRYGNHEETPPQSNKRRSYHQPHQSSQRHHQNQQQQRYSYHQPQYQQSSNYYNVNTAASSQASSQGEYPNVYRRSYREHPQDGSNEQYYRQHAPNNQHYHQPQQYNYDVDNQQQHYEDGSSEFDDEDYSENENYDRDHHQDQYDRDHGFLRADVV